MIFSYGRPPQEITIFVLADHDFAAKDNDEVLKIKRYE